MVNESGRLERIAGTAFVASLMVPTAIGNIATFNTGNSKYGLIGTGVGAGLALVSALGYLSAKFIQTAMALEPKSEEYNY